MVKSLGNSPEQTGQFNNALYRRQNAWAIHELHSLCKAACLEALPEEAEPKMGVSVRLSVMGAKQNPPPMECHKHHLLRSKKHHLFNAGH